MKLLGAILVLSSAFVGYSSCQGAGAKQRIRQELLGYKADAPPADRGTGLSEPLKPTEMSRKLCNARGYQRNYEINSCRAAFISDTNHLNGGLRDTNINYPDGHHCYKGYVCINGGCNAHVYEHFAKGSSPEQMAKKTCKSQGYPRGFDNNGCSAYCFSFDIDKVNLKDKNVNYPDGLPCYDGLTCKNGKCPYPKPDPALLEAALKGVSGLGYGLFY